MNVKIIFTIVFPALLLSKCYSQPLLKSAEFPHPEFYIIGATDLSFPEFIGDLSDTLLVSDYGKEICKWLNQHPNTFNSWLSESEAENIFSSDLYYKSDNEKRNAFDLFMENLKPALAMQQKEQIEQIEKKLSPDKNHAEKYFFYNNIQVYVIGIKEFRKMMEVIK